MKKLLLIASAGALLSLAACKKENNNGGGDNKPSPAVVPQTQQATVFYFGGTWCPPCGAYGKPAKDYIKATYPGKANIISCQVNSSSTQDPMNNASANALAGIFQVSGVPTMYFGGSEMPFAAVGGGTAMQSTSATKIDEIIARTPIANSKFTTTISGNDITVKAETQFFKAVAATEGTYKIAAYVTEDGLNHTQSSDASANKNIHDNVLRTTLGASASGDVLTNSMEQWGVKNFTFFGTLNAAWKKEKMRVTVVIWKQGTDNKLTCVNSWSAPLQ